jgi:hypothetical protein
MPLDRPEDLGTEEDRSRSTIYCIHCYRGGRFTDEAMTLERMRERVREQLEAVHAGDDAIREAIGRLPQLSRWLGIPAIHHSCQRH